MRCSSNDCTLQPSAAASRLGPLLGIENHVPRVPVQALLQALLVQGVANEANAPGQHEQTIEVADLDDVFDLSLHTRSLWYCCTGRTWRCRHRVLSILPQQLLDHPRLGMIMHLNCVNERGLLLMSSETKQPLRN